MSIMFGIACLLCMSGAVIAKENEFFHNYMSMESTTAIKGIFVILVFFRHASQYLELSGKYDAWFRGFNSYLGQLLVVLFLFYSGYGITVSIRMKGLAYIKGIPKRAARVWMHFCIAVCLFAILDLILGIRFTGKQFFLSLVCWESIGNSNWYIMAILVTYLITFLAFIVFQRKYYIAAFMTSVLTVVFILILMQFKENWWYNTMLCYPLGVWYALLKDKFENVVMKNDVLYFAALFAVIIIFYLSFSKRSESVWSYEICAMLFAVLVTLITMKMHFENSLIQFMGNHVFSLYILQRLPMIFMNKMYSCNSHPYVFFVVAFMSTIVIALLFDRGIKIVDKAVFAKARA